METGWIVMSGEFYESGNIVGLYSTREKALEALVIDAGLPKGWNPPEGEGSDYLHVTWWRGGGYTTMSEHAVE